MPTTTHILSDETGQLMLDELEGIHEALDNGTFGGIPMSQKGAANGVATLDASSHVPSGQLPSYVDDVIEGYYYNGAFYSDSAHTTLITGETGKIYVDLSSDTSYRWSGSAYISISNPIDVATEQEALAGNDNTKMMTPLRTKQVVDSDITPNSVSATGEVAAHETVGGSSVTHNLTEKLDEDDYLAGMTWDMLEAHFTWDDLDGTNTSGSDTYTTNLHLTKAGRLSTVGVNGNMDILDEKIGAIGETSIKSQLDALNTYVSKEVYIDGEYIVMDGYRVGDTQPLFRFTYIPSTNRLNINVRTSPTGAWHAASLNMS